MQNEDSIDHLGKWQMQLRKSVLIYMVLVMLTKGEMYGYALISSLSEKMATNMAEGTIYPLLNRMVRGGLVTFEWRIMESGPARKYYQISESGYQLLEGMDEHWQNVNISLQVLRDD